MAGLSTLESSRVLHRHQIDRLLRGQTKLESSLCELHKNIERLPQQVAEAVMQCTGTSPGSPVEALSPSYHGDTDTVYGTFDIQEEIPSSHNVLRRGHLMTAHGSMLAVPTNHGVSGLERNTSVVASALSGAFRPHAEFLEWSNTVSRTGYAHIPDMVRKQRKAARQSAERSRTAVYLAGSSSTSRSYMMHPASKWRSLFDVLIITFLLVDAITVPYTIAWDDDSDWLLGISWATAIFWSLDIVLNFCTGYIHGAQVEMQWKRIACRYLRNGFLIDFLVVALEYVLLITREVSPDMRNNGSLKLIKMLRFFKITRLIRVMARVKQGLLSRIDDVIAYWVHLHGLLGYEHYINFAQILLKTTLVIAWLNHAGSCIWYGVESAIETDSISTWKAGLENGTWGSEDMYMAGFYWAISTMFSGSSHMPPNNISEALFAITWLVMGALFVTSITSTLAAKVIEAQDKMGEMIKKTRDLNTWMSQWKTPVLVALAVQADFNEQLLRTPPLTERDLPFLDTVDAKLRAELRKCHYEDAFLKLPLFQILRVLVPKLEEETMQMFCFTWSTFETVRPGEGILEPGENVLDALLLSAGTAEYTHHPLKSAESDAQMTLGLEVPSQSDIDDDLKIDEPVTVKAKHWISELALFMEWKSVGVLEAASSCEMLLLSVDGFKKAVAGSVLMATMTSCFAVQLCEALMEASPNRPTDIDPLLDQDMVISRLPVALRREVISEPVLWLMKKQAGNNPTSLFKKRDQATLESEVMSGKCHLIMGPGGNVRRIVRVVVLRLLNTDGMLCVQFAEKKGNDIKAKFQLPGRAVEDMTPEEVIDKLLGEEFGAFSSHIKRLETKTVVDMDQFEKDRTKYIKLVHTAQLSATMVPALGMCEPQPSTIASLNSTSSNLFVTTIGTMSGKRYTNTLKGKPSRSNLDRSERTASSCALHINPIASEGYQNVFAIGSGETGRIRVDKIKVYKWLDVCDFNRLFPRREEAVKDLESLLGNGLSFAQTQELINWDLRPMETADVEPRVSFAPLAPEGAADRPPLKLRASQDVWEKEV